MKKHIGLLWGVAAALSVFAQEAAPSAAGVQAARGTTVFADDFSTVATYAEKWEQKGPAAGIKDGKLRIAGGQVSQRPAALEDFYLAAELTPVEDTSPKHDKSGWAGIDIDGVKFLLTGGGGAWYNAKGAVMKDFPDSGLGKPAKIELTRKKTQDGTYQYTFRANGALISKTFVPDASRIPKVTLMCYRLTFDVDNYELCKLRSVDESPNQVLNSSCEYLQEDYIPRYFTSLPGRVINGERSFDDYVDALMPDGREKHSGERSIRLKTGEHVTTAAITTGNVGVSLNQPFTFSVWLKASETNFPVELTAREIYAKTHSKKITLSDKWERYSLTVDSPNRVIVRCGVSFSKRGMVWADDFQVEIGTAMTPYRPSDLDKEKFQGGKSTIPEPKPLAAKRLSSPPAMDGALEKVWFKDAERVDGFFCLGQDAPPLKTQAYIGYDDENLYIGIKACAGDLGKVTAARNRRDDSATLNNGDCIELFLDRGRTKKEYFQISANAAGAQFDTAPGKNIGWDGDWTVATARNEKEQAVEYEFKIPFSELAAPNFTEAWGINIGRTCPSSPQRSWDLKRNPKINYNLVEAYPALKMPREIVERYAVGVTAAGISQGVNGKRHTLNLDLSNRTPRDKNVVVEVFDAADNRRVASFSGLWKKGDSSVSMPLDVAAPKPCDLLIKARESGKPLLSSKVRAVVRHALSVLPRYNYYMNEESAQLLVTMNVAPEKGMQAFLACGAFSKEIPVAKRQYVQLPIKDLPAGRHTVTLSLRDGAKTICDCKADLVKKVYFKGASQIDRIRRCLRHDGKPIIPVVQLEVLIGNAAHQQVLKDRADFMAKYGFRNVMVCASTGCQKQLLEYLKHLEGRGMGVIVWPKDFADIPDIDPVPLIKQFTVPNNLAFLILDEPEICGVKPEYADKLMDRCRAAAEYHPVHINYTVLGIPGRWANLNTDFLAVDDYITNADGRTVAGVLDYVRMMWKTGEESGKPVFFFTSGMTFFNHEKEVTYDEQMALSYGLITEGCTGIEYFLGIPVLPGNWKAMVQVNREVTELTPAICSPEDSPDAIVSDSAIRFITRKLEDKLYVIAVNAEEREAAVTVSLPAGFTYAEQADVRFEDRKLPVASGAFKDTFKPLSRHVYAIGLKTEAAGR